MISGSIFRGIERCARERGEWRAALAVLLLLFSPRAGAQEEPVTIQFSGVLPSVIRERLETVKARNSDRQATLEALFREAGCDDMAQQRVGGSKEPNVICTLGGGGDSTILVGAHFDADSHGSGAVDDWSGASLLPSLYQSLKNHPRRHRFLFVGFSAEEKGLVGSTNYVKHLSKEDKTALQAMVNLECLGLAPPAVWAFRADKRLLEAYLRVASQLNMPRRAVNVQGVADDDSHPFLDAKVPVITIHSLTRETFSVLHSIRDQVSAINPDQYYSTYRLVTAYLAYLDSTLD